MLEYTIITSQPFNTSQPSNIADKSDHFQTPLTMFETESDSDNDCPLGLKNLTIIDHLVIKSEIVDFLRETSYQFFNDMDQLLFFSHSKFRFYEIFCCCRNAPDAVIYISDRVGEKVIRVMRRHVCCGIFCCHQDEACLLEVIVEAPIGEVIGKVKQKSSVLSSYYDIMTEEDELIFKMFGPKCACCGACHCCSKDYFIFTPDMNIFVGKIKKWPGFLKTSDFDLLFPMNLDVKTKTILIGAIFLIDFVFGA